MYYSEKVLGTFNSVSALFFAESTYLHFGKSLQIVAFWVHNYNSFQQGEDTFSKYCKRTHQCQNWRTLVLGDHEEGDVDPARGVGVDAGAGRDLPGLGPAAAALLLPLDEVVVPAAEAGAGEAEQEGEGGGEHGVGTRVSHWRHILTL